MPVSLILGVIQAVGIKELYSHDRIIMTTIRDMEIQILFTYDNVFQLFISKKRAHWFLCVWMMITDKGWLMWLMDPIRAVQTMSSANYKINVIP